MNAHLRMEKILTVIEANPGITGQKIADICAVPWGVIQKDLETMSLATENPIPLYTDNDAENLLNDELESNTPETKWFLDTSTRKHSPIHLTVGEALQVLDLTNVDAKHPKLLSLKQKVFNGLNLDYQGTYRYIKGSMAPVKGINDEELLVVEKAIISN